MRAVPYFLNKYNTQANQSLDIYFDFTRPTGGTPIFVENKSGYYGGYPSGIIIGQDASFWTQNSGSGYLGASGSIKIQTTGDLDLCYGTYSLIYEKQSTSGNTLISTIEKVNSQSGTFYKGFEFGVSANNYLYFEYYNNDGPKILFSEINLSDKASVFLTLSDSSVTFGNYDFYRQKINSKSFSINNNYLFNPSGLYLGRNLDYPSTYSYNTGSLLYIDEFAFFSNPLYNFELVNLNSGYAHTYFSDTQYIQTFYTTGITGYVTGVTGYYSYVTGQTLMPTGVISDIFGNEYTGYLAINLTGTLTGTGITSLTGSIPYTITGYSGAYVQINTEYVNTFGKKAITFLTPVDSLDLVEIFLPDSNYPYRAFNNLDTKYNYVENKFSNQYITDNNLPFIVFCNGLAQNSGSFSITGNIYSSKPSLVNDYITDSSNRVLFKNDFNNLADSVFFDTITGNYDINYYIENFNFAPSQNLTVLNWPKNYNIFFNGQKLSSGTDGLIGSLVHYGLTGSDSTGIYIKNTGMFIDSSGQLFALPRNFSYILTGNKSNYLFNIKYMNNYSEVYLNGVRQYPEDGYIELGASAFIANKSGIFEKNNDLIYNNNDFI